MKTEEDFKKVKQLVNGDKYEFVRILEDSEINKLTDEDDINYHYYKVLGKTTASLDGKVENIYHNIDGVFSYLTLGSLNLVFPNDL